MRPPADRRPLDLEAPSRRTATAPTAATPSARRRRLRRAGAAGAVLAVLAAGGLARHALQRSGSTTPPPPAGAGLLIGTDGGPDHRRAYAATDVRERTDAALAEYTLCAAAVSRPRSGGQDRRAATPTTAQCRSAYRTTLRTISADLARALSAGAQDAGPTTLH